MSHRVLVIDDSADVHTLLQVMLAPEPISLEMSLSGEDGLAKATANPPDLILLDVDMPQPDGFAVCRLLKDNPVTCNVPVIFLTGIAGCDDKARGLNLGAMDYVTKPFDATELSARVGAALRTKYLIDLLERRAMLDGLTGLWNRAYFDQYLETERANWARLTDPTSCILADIDYFKRINDTYGHPAGDTVLRTVAQLLQSQLKPGEVLARIGGEEFGILLPGIAYAKALWRAEQMRAAIQNSSIVIRQAVVQVTGSFGVADTSDEPDLLVDRADEALYLAKRQGRNRVELNRAQQAA